MITEELMANPSLTWQERDPGGGGERRVTWFVKHRSSSGQLALQLSNTLLSQLALRLQLKQPHRVRTCVQLVSQLLHLVLKLLQVKKTQG